MNALVLLNSNTCLGTTLAKLTTMLSSMLTGRVVAAVRFWRRAIFSSVSRAGCAL